MRRQRRIRIFFDGGCRPNPGEMEIAVVALGRTYVSQNLGLGTNSDAEWLALIEGLRIARSLDLTNFVLVGDSAMVVNQANGAKCGSTELRAHLETFRALALPLGSARVRRIGRAQNLAGIALANLHDR
ncbi:ribonuclease HI [Sphingomonas sp. UYAg733]